MKKFNIIDGIIIAVLVVVVAFAGIFFIKSTGTKSTRNAENTKVTFTVECAELHKEILDNLNGIEGKPVVYGVSKSDNGIVKKVEIKPTLKMIQDKDNGEFKYTTYADRYTAFVTIETEVAETPVEFRQDKEQVRIGARMPIRGLGYATDGYITEMYK